MILVMTSIYSSIPNDMEYESYIRNRTDLKIDNLSNDSWILRRNPCTIGGIIVLNTSYILDKHEVIDLTTYTKAKSMDIYGIIADTILLPIQIKHLKIYRSNIKHINIPTQIHTITLKDCLGMYDQIQPNIPNTIQAISVANDHITNLVLSNCLTLVQMYKCNIDKITNESYHIDQACREHTDNIKQIVLNFDKITSPYNITKITIYCGGALVHIEDIYTSLEKMYIIQQTNQAILL
jgi:hypothetical protein